MWLKPSGYVMVAIVAGALSAGGTNHWAQATPPLVVLWLLLDMLPECLERSLRMARRKQARPVRTVRVSLPGFVSALIVAVLTAALAVPFSRPVQFVVGAAALIAGLLGIAGYRLPRMEASALLRGIQVSLGWGAAWLVFAHDPLQPALALSIPAGVGTWARLASGAQQQPARQWVGRLCWAALLAAVVIARQPLLAGLVALSAAADDLHRDGAAERVMSRLLGSAAWVSAWLLVAAASTGWSA